MAIQQPVHRRIIDYLQKYKMFLVLLSVILGDFYSAVNLAKSRLLYVQLFNLQLTLSEKQHLII